VIVSLIAVGIALALARFFIVRYTADTALATIVASALAVAFVVGYLAHPFERPTSEGSTDPQVGVAADPADANADVHDVSADCRAFSGQPADGGNGFVDQIVAERPAAQPVPAGGSIASDASYDVLGWATSSDGKHVARAVCLFVDGRVFAKATSLYGASRPDVASSSSDPSLAPSGFKIVIPPNALPKGAHHLSVGIVSPDGTADYAHDARDVVIR
jgi:hypothetical protein